MNWSRTNRGGVITYRLTAQRAPHPVLAPEFPSLPWASGSWCSFCLSRFIEWHCDCFDLSEWAYRTFSWSLPSCTLISANSQAGGHFCPPNAWCTSLVQPLQLCVQSHPLTSQLDSCNGHPAGVCTSSLAPQNQWPYCSSNPQTHTVKVVANPDFHLFTYSPKLLASWSSLGCLRIASTHAHLRAFILDFLLCLCTGSSLSHPRHNSVSYQQLTSSEKPLTARLYNNTSP